MTIHSFFFFGVYQLKLRQVCACKFSLPVLPGYHTYHDEYKRKRRKRRKETGRVVFTFHVHCFPLLLPLYSSPGVSLLLVRLFLCCPVSSIKLMHHVMAMRDRVHLCLAVHNFFLIFYEKQSNILTTSFHRSDTLP